MYIPLMLFAWVGILFLSGILGRNPVAQAALWGSFLMLTGGMVWLFSGMTPFTAALVSPGVVLYVFALVYETTRNDG